MTLHAKPRVSNTQPLAYWSAVVGFLFFSLISVDLLAFDAGGDQSGISTGPDGTITKVTKGGHRPKNHRPKDHRPTDNPPEDSPPEQPPEDSPPEEPPEDSPPEEPPEDSPPEEPPEDSPPEQPPEDSPPEEPPVDNPPEEPPVDNPPEQPPEDSPPEEPPVDNPPEDSASRPFGIYSLDRTMDLPFVDGVVIRTHWSEVEREEGRYDFSEIERVVREAVALDQDVTLANLVFSAPTWLSSSAETFIDGDGQRKVVPWDPVVLSALERLAQAQSNFEVDGIPLRDHPNVKQVNASIGGISSLRMTALPAGYSVERITDAVLQSARAWADAYPVDKHLYMGIFVVNDGLNNPSTAELIRDQLLAEFNGRDNPRINFFQENLTGEQPFAEGVLGELLIDVQDQTGIMMQACGSWTEQNGFFAQCTWTEPVDTPDNGFSHGVNDLGATYFEIYSMDLENPAYTDDFERWWPVIQGFGEQ